MIVLGLDPSLTSFGWSIHDTGASGKNRFVGGGTYQTKSKDMFVSRYMSMRESIIKLTNEYKPDKVSIEFPVFKEDYSEGMYGLFLYSCEALYNQKMDVVFFDNSQIKALCKRLIKRPSGWLMGKVDVREAAANDTGIKKWGKSDISDAYMIAYAGGRFWGYLDGTLGSDSLMEYEKKLFFEVKCPKKGKMAGREIKRGISLRENERFFVWSKGTETGGEIGKAKEG